MLHAELFDQVDHSGFVRLACPGELAPRHGDFADPVPTAAGVRERTVTLWICQGCGHLLSVSEGTLLNDYPPPQRLAGELARALTTEEAQP